MRTIRGKGSRYSPVRALPWLPFYSNVLTCANPSGPGEDLIHYQTWDYMHPPCTHSQQHIPEQPPVPTVQLPWEYYDVHHYPGSRMTQGY